MNNLQTIRKWKQNADLEVTEHPGNSIGFWQSVGMKMAFGMVITLLEQETCEHTETIDIGDSEHTVIACAVCEKILR